ncbi:MAG: family 10 glycosylhydrolase [Verrucomicrobiota bacterium]|nr:family 10 glycosylhydrolase [Verrucomicrobiota bacterium]
MHAFCAGLVFFCVHSYGGSLTSLESAVIQGGPGTLPPKPTGEGLLFSIPPQAPDGRVYWDIPISPPAEQDSAIRLILSCDQPGAIRALSLHLQSHGDWLSASLPSLDGTLRQSVSIPRTSFTAEAGKPEWSKANTLRLSAWLAEEAGLKATLAVHAIDSFTPSIAILADPSTFSAAEAYLANQCAQRAQRLFEKAGLLSTILQGNLESLDLRTYSILVLPYNPILSIPQLDTLERYCKRHNGLLAVFYNANTRLADLLGMDFLSYISQSTDWTAVSFSEETRALVPGLPTLLPHITQHLFPVRAKADNAKTMGLWLTSHGVPDRTLPASAVSPRGLAFSHIPPLATSSAIRWLLAALAEARPKGYASLRDAYLKEEANRTSHAEEVLNSIPAQEDEVRAIWSLPIATGLRGKTLDQLVERRINTLFEQTTLAPPSIRTRNAVEAVRKRGLQPHAWVYALNAETLSHSPSSSRLMQNAKGAAIAWLCPLHPENRALLEKTLLSIARTDIAGIQLDYIRYPGREGCYCPLHRNALEKQLNRKIEAWPEDVLPGGPLAEAFHQLCRDDLTDLVETITRALREARPDLLLSAAVYPIPSSAAENAQDWPSWLNKGLLDFVAPMIYTPSASQFSAFLAQDLDAAPRADALLPGIGISADETQLDRLAAAEQIRVTRQQKTRGYSLFQLTPEFLNP